MYSLHKALPPPTSCWGHIPHYVRIDFPIKSKLGTLLKTKQNYTSFCFISVQHRLFCKCLNFNLLICMSCYSRFTNISFASFLNPSLMWQKWNWNAQPSKQQTAFQLVNPDLYKAASQILQAFVVLFDHAKTCI